MGAVLAGREAAWGCRLSQDTPTTSPLRRQLERLGRRRPTRRALAASDDGVAVFVSLAVWAELGGCRRFSRSMHVVGHLEVVVLFRYLDSQALSSSSDELDVSTAEWSFGGQHPGVGDLGAAGPRARRGR